MTTQEFSSEFDILYNNIMSNIAPGLTEYEKSVFLTQAQEQIVLEIYNGRYNGAPFENSEEVRSYIRSLIESAAIPTTKVEEQSFPDQFYHYVVNAYDSNVWFVIFESVEFAGECPCTKGKKVVVKPVSYDEYWATSRNPFKGPTENRVLRMDKSAGEFELISDYEINTYTMSYMRRPHSIILETLEEAYPSINGERETQTCELAEILHRPILERAVLLAKAVWGTTQQEQ